MYYFSIPGELKKETQDKEAEYICQEDEQT